MAILITKTALTFSDVLIVPQYSEVLSRSKVTTLSDMGKFVLKIPVISANMKDITGVKMCIEMAHLGAMGILHRFMSADENVIQYQDILCKLDSEEGDLLNSPEWSFGVSVGVKEEEKTRFDKLYRAGAKIFTLDIAHGDSLYSKNMLKYMRDKAGDSIYIIAGNIATGEAAKRLIEWGSDCLKSGVGPGNVCATRTYAGVGVPQLTAVMDVCDAVKEINPNIKIISDGGIKFTGDVAKALAYSNAVMIGSMFSGTTETPGKVYKNENGKYYKTYGGSASGENKNSTNQDTKFVEGMVKTVDFKGHVKYIVREIHDGVRSAFSYSGANNFEEYQENVMLRTISGGGKAESKI